mgnify:CR=1 FL=1
MKPKINAKAFRHLEDDDMFRGLSVSYSANRNGEL